MSLINEALKKAQHMRHQDPAGGVPLPAGSPTPSIEAAPAMPLRRGRTPPSQVFLFAAIGVPVLIAVSVGVTFLLLRSDGPPAVAQSAPPASAPASAVPAEFVPAEIPQVAIALPPTIVADAPVPEPAPVSDPTPAPEVVAVPVAAVQVAAPPQSSMPDPRVNAFLDRLRVSGIRASATDPRVSMNNRIFRLNEIVDRNLELRIIGIAPEGLTFIDPNGVVYNTLF